ncbi:MAG: RagB/SusD domain protein, partial [Daejeonella sp.]|nr:RagB/SusD domain protein [Daejeonella sp.]
MKTQIIKFILIGSFALSACQKTLDQDPLDKISASNFWKSRADLDAALAATYATLQAPEWSHELPVWDCITDNGFAQHNSGGAKDIVSGSISPSTGGLISTVYTDSYKGITRINLFLKQLAAYQGSDMPENDKKKYEAEVRFIRAYYYFQLYRSYGDVPLILEPLTLETQNQAKVPAEQILTQIIADLDYSIANLSPNPYYQNAGHATASSAQALKARVLLFAAYGNTGTPNVTILGQVRDLALEVMSKYTLSSKFEDIFQDAGQKNNPEIIFSVNYLAPNNTAPWDMYYGDWLVASPLQNFVNSFEYSDGLPPGVSPLTNLAAPFENRDPRLKKTVFVDHPDF